jgi:hypothetical protein
MQDWSHAKAQRRSARALPATDFNCAKAAKTPSAPRRNWRMESSAGYCALLQAADWVLYFLGGLGVLAVLAQVQVATLANSCFPAKGLHDINKEYISSLRLCAFA